MSAESVWSKMWRWIASLLRIRTRYMRAIENENTRLREENRALMNSILGLAGIPPMRVRARSSDDAHIPVAFGPANDSGQLCARLKAASTKPESHGAIHVANSGAPLRRRSWQQLGRVREIEDARAARRERESDTDTFPAPSNIVVRN